MSLRANLKLPKEHGAWAMFYVPFVLGITVAGTINFAVLLLLLATTALFISRESLLIWWRAKKRERSTEASAQAGRLLIGYFAIAAITGLPLLIVYRLFWLLPLVLLGGILLTLNGWQATDFEDRTIQSEILAITGMTMTAPAAYYVASGVWGKTALWLWALSAAYFISSVFYVKLRVTGAHAKSPQARTQARIHCIAYHVFLLLALLALAVTHSLPIFALLAFAPVLLRTAWSLLKPATKLNLKQIGIAEIVYSLLFLLFTVLSFRYS